MNKKDLKTEHIIEKGQMIKTNPFVTYDKIAGYDDYGWPTYHLRVISFLRILGVPENIIKQIPENILKTHISTSADICTNCNIDLEKGEIYVF